MGISVFPAAGGGLAVGRFPATIGNPFNIPAGLSLRNTVTSTTTFTAGQLPAQVWVVMMGGGGAGGAGTSYGGGGGAGGACIGWVDVPSSGITATIGAGGVGSSGSAGAPGGSTTFGGYTAWGGGGGAEGQWGTQGSRCFARGPGAGHGGMSSNSDALGVNLQYIAPGSAPLLGGLSSEPGSSGGYFSTFRETIFDYRLNNYVGGGAGGCGNYALPYRGGHGLAGGGSCGQTGGTAGYDGGHSSRNNGVTVSFTGGTPGGSGANSSGGGGAGLLANGSNGSGSTGGAGGSGGGGGGGSYNTAGATGGNGCVLIYY